MDSIELLAAQDTLAIMDSTLRAEQEILKNWKLKSDGDIMPNITGNARMCSISNNVSTNWGPKSNFICAR